jgi:hypothetical protein
MAVVVTLIYLAVQVRHSAVATQAVTLQNSVGNDMQILTSAGATFDEEACAMTGGCGRNEGRGSAAE